LKPSSLTLDKTSPVPIYHQIKEGVIRLIDDGVVKPGDLLPSENELSNAYQISPMTVRQAMKALVDEGYVQRERGRGTFVLQRPMRHQLSGLIGFSEDMQASQMQPGGTILEFDLVPPPTALLQRIPMASDIQLRRIKRVRFANEMPVGIHDSYLQGIDITREELEAEGSLYRLLDAKGMILDEGEEILEATVASAEEAQLLNVSTGFPLLRATRLTWDKDGNFVEFVVALYHADLYQYVIRLKR
jgi:GntR family transcriptional regulator